MTMTAPHAPEGAPLSAEARRLRHALAAASDTALAKVVAVFDRLPDRREADALLDAARPRLRRLRPARPITFTRLLFLPLDGAIVEARAWRRQDGTLPRTALPSLAAALRSAIGADAAAMDAAIAGRSFADLPAIDLAGRRLWRLAAEAAPGLGVPPGWGEAGLQREDFSQAVALAAGVWRQADALWAALAVARHGPPEELVRKALTGAAAEGPLVLGAALATLVMKAAKPGSIASVAAGIPGAPPSLAERVLDDWLEGCVPDIPEADPLAAARMAEEFLEALDDLEQSTLGRRAERRQRIAALRRQAAETCRQAFTETAVAGLLGPLAAAKGAPQPDAAITALEATARQLRRLEQAGRALGVASAFDATVRRMVDQFTAMKALPGTNPADLVRLTEIIAGPEAALRLLDA